MKKYTLFLLTALLWVSCLDKDIHVAEPKVNPVDKIDYNIEGDDLIFTWSYPSTAMTMYITRYINGTVNGETEEESNSYTFTNVESGTEYTFVFKLRDKEGNLSSGTIITYTRAGSLPVENLNMSQVEDQNGYSIHITWTLPESNLSKIVLTYNDGETSTEVILGATTTSYTIPETQLGKTYTVNIFTENEEGTSHSTSSSLRIGSTKVGFLGLYPENEFIRQADDDELRAYYWFKENYITGEYISFTEAATADLSSFRVLWWIRDVDNGDVSVPAAAMAAVDNIKEWYKEGGNLLLWMHAIPYIWELKRFPESYTPNKTIGSGPGEYNSDIWLMNISLGTINKHDQVSHPIYRGVDNFISDNNNRLVSVIGPGWKEDHNYVLVEVPGYYGLGNAEEVAYTEMCKDQNILPLASWSDITDYYMIANWECLSTEEYAGTAICIGLGGMEWSQNNADGSTAPTGTPVNPYQEYIEMITQNAIEYLKTK